MNAGCNGASLSIGRISTSGVVSTFTGPGLDSPFDLTVGSDGAIWFMNSGHYDAATQQTVDQSVGRVSMSRVVTDYADPAIVTPSSLVVGPDGALWFANFGTWHGSGTTATLVGSSIARVSTAGAITTYTGPSVKGPQFMTVASDGSLWFYNSAYSCENTVVDGKTTTGITCQGSSSFAHTTTSGVITSLPPAYSFGVGPTGLVDGPDGAIWMANYGPAPLANIERLTTSGATTAYTATTADGTEIYTPQDLTVGSDGALWFTEQATNAIGRVTPP